MIRVSRILFITVIRKLEVKIVLATYDHFLVNSVYSRYYGLIVSSRINCIKVLQDIPII